MKKTMAFLAFALAVSVVGSAQTSNSQQKPTAAVTGDSATQCAKPLTDDKADLPTGTAIKMKLETPLSSRTNKEGDGFSGRVTEDVVVNGRKVIPVGASVTGRLIKVSDPARIQGVGMIHMLPEAVVLPNGETFAINAAVVDTSLPSFIKVDEEGRAKGKGLSKGDKIEMAAGTGAGMIIGGIAAGGEGILIGAVVGGGTTAMHWLTKKHSVDIPAGTELIFEVSRPMNIGSAPMTAGD